MLAQQGGRAVFELAGASVPAGGAAEVAPGADGGVVEVDEVVSELRVLHDFFSGHDGGSSDTTGLESLGEEVAVPGPGSGRHSVERADLEDVEEVRDIHFIATTDGKPTLVAIALEDGAEEESILGILHAGNGFTDLLGEHRHCRKPGRRLKLGEVDEATTAIPFSGHQGCTYRKVSMLARDRVAGVDAKVGCDLVICIASERDCAAEGIDGGAIAGVVTPGAGSAIGRHADDDCAGIGGMDVRGAKAEAVHRTRGEVVEDDVGPVSKLKGQVAALGSLEVEADVPLVAIALDEVAVLVPGLRASDAVRVAAGHGATGTDVAANEVGAAGTLDLDDVGTLISEHAAAVGPGPDDAKVEDADAVERALPGRCGKREKGRGSSRLRRSGGGSGCPHLEGGAG